MGFDSANYDYDSGINDRYNNVTNSCFCFSAFPKTCTIFTNCDKNNECVRPVNNATACVSNSSLENVTPKIYPQRLSYLPKWIFELLRFIEVFPIGINSFILSKSKQKLKRLPLLFFLLETVLRLALTIVASYVLYHSEGDGHSNDLFLKFFSFFRCIRNSFRHL